MGRSWLSCRAANDWLEELGEQGRPSRPCSHTRWARAQGVSATPRIASTHLAAGVIRQIGARNYAGPNCPGVGWNCTTATRVLQVATDDGGQNVAQCTDATPISTADTQMCTISQTGASNTARCIEHLNAPVATQTCGITQTGARNQAVGEQMIRSNDTVAA